MYTRRGRGPLSARGSVSAVALDTQPCWCMIATNGGKVRNSGTSSSFLADSMLGTLCKWLRILGYDTAYAGRLSDDDIVRLARAEERVLLTRDTGLVQRRGLHALLIVSEHLTEQLAQVRKAFKLSLENAFSRCPVCNTLLENVPKPEAWGQVPPFVFQTQDQFSLCPECNRFYWRGTHWQGILQRIQEMEN